MFGLGIEWSGWKNYTIVWLKKIRMEEDGNWWISLHSCLGCRRWSTNFPLHREQRKVIFFFISLPTIAVGVLPPLGCCCLLLRSKLHVIPTCFFLLGGSFHFFPNVYECPVNTYTVSSLSLSSILLLIM